MALSTLETATLIALVGIRDHGLDGPQTPPGEVAQERGPDLFGNIVGSRASFLSCRLSRPPRLRRFLPVSLELLL
jgi:hypothetical protein